MINTKELIEILSTGEVTGECNKAVLRYSSRDLICEFVAEDRTMFGRVIYEKFNDGNSFFGENPIVIGDVKSLLKMLKTLGDEIDADLEVVGRGQKNLVIKDGLLEMRVPLIKDSQVPKIPKLKTSRFSDETSQSAFIDTQFIKQFYKLSGAMKQCKYIFVGQDNGYMNLYITETEDYMNGVKIDLEQDEAGSDISMTMFNIKMVRTLLYNNKKCIKGKILNHSKLLLTMQFMYKNYVAEFHIIPE